MKVRQKRKGHELHFTSSFLSSEQFYLSRYTLPLEIFIIVFESFLTTCIEGEDGTGYTSFKASLFGNSSKCTCVFNSHSVSKSRFKSFPSKMDMSFSLWQETVSLSQNLSRGYNLCLMDTWSSWTSGRTRVLKYMSWRHFTPPGFSFLFVEGRKCKHFPLHFSLYSFPFISSFFHKSR